MAMAVQKLFPGTQVTIGPWIEKGFYYDFDTKEPITDKDLKKIKKEMVRPLPNCGREKGGQFRFNSILMGAQRGLTNVLEN